MIKLALVTDKPNLHIDYDMPPLLEACKQLSINADVCFWDDPSVDWAAYTAVLIRSPWDCIESLDEFFAWCDKVHALTCLLNVPSVARWGLNKLYLKDIAARGVPIIPSVFLAPDDAPEGYLADFLDANTDSHEFVVKPTIGSYSRGVKRFVRGGSEAALGHIRALQKRGSHVIIQPYITTIDTYGETDLTFFDNTFSHSIRKGAMLMADGTVNVPTPEFRQPREADAEEQAVALSALVASAEVLGLELPLLYGRVDVIRDYDGRPMIMEMEICEPSLNLPFRADSALNLIKGVLKRIDRHLVDL